MTENEGESQDAREVHERERCEDVSLATKMVHCIHSAGVNCHILSNGFQLLRFLVGW